MPTINGKVCVVNGKPVDKVYSNGKQVYGRNLLRNSRGKLQPQNGVTDNYQIFNSVKVYMTQGQKYIISAQAAPGFVFSGSHVPTEESNRIVLWLTNNSSDHFLDPAVQIWVVISGDTTDISQGGTQFTWYYPSGTYNLRVNSYKVDNSGYVENVKIEQGTTATPWTPAPEDVGVVTQ